MQKLIIGSAIVVLINVISCFQGFCGSTESVPDEYRVKEEQLNISNARQDLQYISNSLQGFIKLTDLINERTTFRKDLNNIKTQSAGWSKKSIPDITYKMNITLLETFEIGSLNLDWAFQHIGFPNRLTSIEGTLLKQEAEIKRLEYELLKVNKADNQTLDKAFKEANSSKEKVKTFIDSHLWSD
jgi:hypothetical protein